MSQKRMKPIPFPLQQDRTSFGFEFPWHANVPPAEEVSTLLPCPTYEEWYSCFPQKILGQPNCNRIANSSLDQDIEVAFLCLIWHRRTPFAVATLSIWPSAPIVFLLAGPLTNLMGTLTI